MQYECIKKPYRAETLEFIPSGFLLWTKCGYIIEKNEHYHCRRRAC